jgi:phosphotransferase system IIA component
VIHRPIAFASSKPSAYKHKLPLSAPVSGLVETLTTVPDPSVQSGVWGEGIAIKTRSSALVSPVEGHVEKLDINAQRWFIKAKNGLKLMLQLGIVGKSLHGERLQICKREKHAVKQGDVLSYFDPVFIERHCGHCVCIFTVLNRKGIKALVPALDGARIDPENTALCVYL